MIVITHNNSIKVTPRGEAHLRDPIFRRWRSMLFGPPSLDFLTSHALAYCFCSLKNFVIRSGAWVTVTVMSPGTSNHRRKYVVGFLLVESGP